MKAKSLYKDGVGRRGASESANKVGMFWSRAYGTHRRSDGVQPLARTQSVNRDTSWYVLSALRVLLFVLQPLD